MTREEAIEHLSVLAERMDTKDTDVYVADIPLKCVDMAIEALETEPILDKIRTEIEAEPYISKMEVLDIIDKYKVESESEE